MPEAPKDEVQSPFLASLMDIFESRGIAIGESRGIAIGESRGIAIGESRGIAIGEARGIAIGESRGQRKNIGRLLERRCPDQGAELRLLLERCPDAELEPLMDDLLEFESAEQARAALERRRCH